MHERNDRKPRISAIAAIGKNRELGHGGELIWRIPDDLKHLKELTNGRPIIMGRKTFSSIGRPLSGRTNIILTRDTTFSADGCIIAHSLEEALEVAKRDAPDEIFIFGGAELYTQALPQTDRLYLTIIDATCPNADTFFPPYKNEFTEIIKREKRDHGGLAYEWMTLERG